MRGRQLLMGVAFVAAAAFACVVDDVGTTDEVGGMCEPGEVVDCACSDGSVGEQACAEDGLSFGECDCTGGETGDTGETGETGDADMGEDATTSEDGTTEDTESDATDGTTDDTDTDTDTASGDTTDGPIGEVPVVEIWHPGDGEVRPAGVPFPWTGNAMDAEDGDLSDSLVWWSSLDGEFGFGQSFDAALDEVGEHTIIVEVMDSDGNIGSASIMLTME